MTEMDCPTCKAWAEVKDTRPRKEDNTRYRRYECANGHRFSTLEQVLPPEVLKQARLTNLAKGRKVYQERRA